MSMPRWLPAAALVALLGLAIVGPGLLTPSDPVAAQNDPEVRTVTVTGQAVAKQAPDTATLQVGVVTQANTATAARDQNAEAMAKLREALKRAGVADGDIATSSFSIHPMYDYGPDGREPRISGFQVEQMLQVETKQVDRVGALIDAAVSGGANRVHGVQFSVSDPTALRNHLFDSAVQDARQKAERLAAAAGARVTRVLQIHEHADARTPIVMRVQADAAAAGTIITPGEQDVAASVTVVFEMQ